MGSSKNLVVMLSDQQRADTMRCYGNEWINTPNLNALAESSFVFRNAYVTQPVCTPSRASIMTGLYPHSAGPTVNKMHLPETVPTIAELIADEYHCAYMGKWHLGDDVLAQHGFDTWVSTEDGHRNAYLRREARNRHSDYHRFLVEHGFKPDQAAAGVETFSAQARQSLGVEFQMASFLGQRAAAFIRERAGRPFVLYVSTFEPHPPFFGPLDDMYDPDAPPVGPAFLRRPEGGSLIARARADYCMQWLNTGKKPSDQDYILNAASAMGNDVTSEAGWRRLRARYFANVTLVDNMVGSIVEALKETGVYDDTVVAFTSEHGEMAGDHGMLEKRSFYEESARVPLLMRVPWLSTGQTFVEGSASLIDLVPTLLDLLDQPVPGHLEGTSRTPVLKGESTLAGEPVFIEWNGVGEVSDRDLGNATINRLNALPWRSVVLDRWKLNLCAGDQCELFDLRSDPREMENLYDRPEHRDRVREMAALIRTWQHWTDDTVPLPST